jgi:amino acid transporter
MDSSAALTPTLRRGMSPFGGLLITLSGLSPGIGVFIVGAGLFHQVGSGAVLCFLVAIAVGIAMSQVYAELGSAFPHAGAEYTMVGRTLAPEAGFAVLSLMVPAVAIALAFNCLGAGTYAHAALPALPAVPVAIAMVLAATLISVLSVQVNAAVTGVFLAVEIGALMLVTALGFTHAHRAVLPMLLHPVQASGAGLGPVPFGPLSLAVAGGIYAFNGYGTAVYFGEEILHARRSMAGIIYGALGLAALTQMPPMLAVLAGAPDLNPVFADAAPVAAFVRTIGGEFLGRLLNLAVAAAIFNAMIALVLSGARQFYASARDGSWPASVNRALVLIHPRFRSPWAATIAVGLPGVGLCFVPTQLLLMLLAGGNIVVYALLCLAVIAGRRNGSTAHSEATMPLYPLAPVFGLMATAGIAVASLMDPDTGRPGLAIVAVIMLAGAAYYRLVLRNRDGFAFREPEDATD